MSIRKCNQRYDLLSLDYLIVTLATFAPDTKLSDTEGNSANTLKSRGI
ncbi:hypothetical protein KL86CIT2_530009 [uncultured Citrobacter sp.]|uniref:Uncharacterized protein n=1 Tax=uncultured Citrobacter sp. TaxID=200446 RepID=A0A212IK36_9ENTR|nr:hypothetical protein KL86CIT2_530009 [uncultured Citrobacter sp.]